MRHLFALLRRSPVATGVALAFAASFLPSSAARSADYRLEKLDEAAPKSVAEAVQKTLSATGLRVFGTDGKPFVDVWFREKLPVVDARPVLGVDFGRVQEGSLVGVVQYHTEGQDFRGNAIVPGVYTLRKITQPEDGDHLGVSETRDFLLACPAKDDKDPAALTPKATIKLSTAVSGSKHPSVLYLVKRFDPPKDLPRLVHDEDFDYWLLDVELPAESASKAADADGETEEPAKSDEKPVRFGLVAVGKAVEF